MKISRLQIVEAALAATTTAALTLAVVVALRVGIAVKDVFAFLGSVAGVGFAVLGAVFVERLKARDASKQAEVRFQITLAHIAYAASMFIKAEDLKLRAGCLLTYHQAVRNLVRLASSVAPEATSLDIIVSAILYHEDRIANVITQVRDAATEDQLVNEVFADADHHVRSTRRLIEQAANGPSPWDQRALAILALENEP